MVKPFLRWAGGKSWLLKYIGDFLPYRIRDYYEPFLGGASVFLHLKQEGILKRQAVLSDINGDLIGCYLQVRDDVESVIEHLKQYRNDKTFYYEIRELKTRTASEKAAKFIFLNRTSFNGVYRVNLKGIYNVPYGYKSYRALFDYENIRAASRLLQDTVIAQQDFQIALECLHKTDFAFLDPPYTVAHGNNGFIKYNQKLFSWNDQERLAKSMNTLVKRGANYVLTNASHPSIASLFASNGDVVQLNRYSLIGGKNAKRGLTSEYVFTSVAWNDMLHTGPE